MLLAIVVISWQLAKIILFLFSQACDEPQEATLQ